ncbi:MAG: 50S ribosomal protein L30 [Anaerolineae bacterium]|nr:MAG: 50S ribosomal protein L30 [Anaerolineae bacterium]
MAKNKDLKVTLVRSPIGFDVRQKKTLIALGLRKMNQTVTQADTPAVRGMIRKVIHLVKVEE